MQPQVPKHLRVLRQVGLVRVRGSGQQRLYKLDGVGLKPIHDWVKTFERFWNESMDRLDDYLRELQTKEKKHGRKKRYPLRPVREEGDESPRRRTIMTYALWIVQGLLALLFLFAGGMKLVLPLEALTGPMPLPGLFVRFIGVAEVLGALGLILPGLLRIRPGLTPLAAAGLVIIMIGATVTTLAGGDLAAALTSVVVGLLSAFVAYGRWRLTPHRGSSRPSVVRREH